MLFTLIGKNFKQLLRSKTSSLIILLGPLLVITLLGFAFNNSNEYALNIGVYSDAYSETSNEFIEALEAENYIITKLNAEVDCVNAVKETSLHACIIFPPNLVVDDTNNKQEITFYVDSSNENLVFNIINAITQKLGNKNKEISKQLLDNMITTINNIDHSLENTEVNLLNISEDLEQSQDYSEDAIDTLDELGLDYTPTSSANISPIAASNDDAYEELVDATEESIENIEDAMDDLSDLVPGISNSSIRSDVNDIIDDVLDYTNSSESAIDSGNYSTMYGLVTNLMRDLNSINTKLSNAQSASQDVEDSINEIISKLEDSSTKMSNVLSSIDNIQENIATLKAKDPDALSTPFDIKINYEKPNHFGSMFAGMIIIVIMFISLLLSTQLIISDRNSPAFFRNMISPLNSFVYILAMYITNLIITALQVAIMLAVAVGYFKLSFELPYVILILIIATSIFSFIGMIIGYFFNSEETATIAAISTSALLMFLSDLIIPIESIPRLLLKYIKYNPVYRFKTIINMFNNNNPKIVLIALQNEFYIYLGIIVGLAVITLLFAYMSRKNFFKFLHKKHHKKDKKIKNAEKIKTEQARSEKKTKSEKKKKPKKKK